MFRPSHSLAPYWGNLVEPLEFPSRIFDQNFGLNIRDEDLIPTSHLFIQPHNQPWPMGLASHRPQRLHSPRESGVSEVQLTKDKFEVKLDVQQFAPEEVHVKTVENYVIIEGKHEEKEDPHGFISRHFTRKYHLPEGVKGESVNCNLSSDGILTISAVRELPSAPELKEEGVPVPITHTGKPAIAEAKSKHGKKLK